MTSASIEKLLFRCEEKVWISSRGPLSLDAQWAIHLTPLLPCVGSGLVAVAQFCQKKNMSDVEVTFLNREKGRFLDFWRIQIHQRSMKCVFKAWRFSLRSQLRIQKHRVGAVREKIAVSLNEAEAVLTKTMPRQVRLCWLNHVEKNWQTKVVDDIKGPCRDCTVCLNLIEFIYCIWDGYDWKLCFLLCI